MPCATSHHSYLLLHFVTICDLCSYEFSKDPFNAGCHTDWNRNLWKIAACRFFSIFRQTRFLRIPCRHGTKHPTQRHRLFLSLFPWKLKRISSFLPCIRASQNVCRVCVRYCRSSCICMYEGEIKGKKQTLLKTNHAKRVSCTQWLWHYSIYHK